MTPPDDTADVLVVGGGLAGLALADRLITAGLSVRVLEARDRLGGRVLTRTHDGVGYDLGPAWIWPGQPRLAALLQRLSLTVHEQWSAGQGLFEDSGGALHKMRGAGSMAGSYRIGGGVAAMVAGLAARLPRASVSLLHEVTALSDQGDILSATCRNGAVIRGRQVVLALPPRLAAGIACDPELPAAALAAMHRIPTWMAGHAKAIAIYPAPFWRQADLSGDAISQRGPLAEIHDASPASGQTGALFGFVDPAAMSGHSQEDLRAAVAAQLERLFGPAARTPTELLLKDWSRDAATAVAADQRPQMAHPAYGMPPALTGLWRDRLILGGTEVAAEFGGFLEGALEAAEAAAEAILAQRQTVAR